MAEATAQCTQVGKNTSTMAAMAGDLGKVNSNNLKFISVTMKRPFFQKINSKALLLNKEITLMPTYISTHDNL